MPGAAGCGKGQAARLGALPAVSAAAAQYGAEPALARNTHAQRTVYKAFQFYIRGHYLSNNRTQWN